MNKKERALHLLRTLASDIDFSQEVEELQQQHPDPNDPVWDELAAFAEKYAEGEDALDQFATDLGYLD